MQINTFLEATRRTLTLPFPLAKISFTPALVSREYAGYVWPDFQSKNCFLFPAAH